MNTVEQALGICSLIADGVTEWSNLNPPDYNDWSDVLEAQAKEEFAIAILHKTDNESARIIIAQELVQVMHNMATDITINWDEDELNRTPSLWKGITEAESFLKEFKS
jgi:hypothetical protein